MSFVGINVTFGFIQASQEAVLSPSPIYGPSSASQAFTAAGTTTPAALPGPNATFLPAVFLTVQDAADAIDWWITIGPTPPDPLVDQPVGGRHLLLASEISKQIFCKPGDKVRVAPVP